MEPMCSWGLSPFQVGDLIVQGRGRGIHSLRKPSGTEGSCQRWETDRAKGGEQGMR